MSRRVSARALLVATLLVTAGCADLPTRTGPDGGDDPLGWEAGYWYNESIDVDGSDGFSTAEVEVVAARMMARLERLRGREFRETVSVTVISRAEFRERNSFGGTSSPVANQSFEALFLVPETVDSGSAVGEVFGSSVVGYYSGGDIVLVSDTPGNLSVSRSTLVHELVHALQDQYDSFGGGDGTRDGRLAALGVTEGEANYLMDRYLERCESAWACIAPPPERGGGSGGSFNRGLFLVSFLPYSDGPTFVAALRERGGWAALERAYDDGPTSTEQLIHPERYPDDDPTTLRVPDRSASGWERVGSDRLGEAALYATMWANGVIPEAHLFSDDSRYNYSHPITTGWEGDRLVAYRNDDRYGYVFETAWETRADARAFSDAYRAVLLENGARAVRPDEGLYRIPDDRPYGDAFRLVRDGTRVRVVNAPTVQALTAVHPDGTD